MKELTHAYIVDSTSDLASKSAVKHQACYSAYVFDADRRAKLLTSVESMGSKFGAEQQTPTDSRSSKCSARRPLRARSTSPDRASLRSAGTKPESTAPFRRRPCASRASSRPTGLDRAPFAPGRPEKGILAPRRLSFLLTRSGAETPVFWASQPLAWLVAPKDVPLMTRRGDLKLSHGATAKARENAVKRDRVQTTNAIKSP